MKARSSQWRVAAIACVIVGAFYLWTVRSTAEPWKFGEEQRDYYNLLIDGWLEGQLHMKVDVSPALLQLADPYDPKTRPPGVALHDASLFRGKYYVYFGAAPVVTLMLPFRLLTGTDLPLAVATLIFVYAGFLASVAMFLAVRRRYFQDTSVVLATGAVFALGFAGLGPLLLRRPHMWELPIGAGYCFAMLTLVCLWRSLHAGSLSEAHGGPMSVIEQARRHRSEIAGRKRRRIWLAAAAVCLGLAIASRPTYLVAIPLVLVPLGSWWREERRMPWRCLLAAAAPLLAIGGILAWHNHARFGNALEFGQAYQLSFDREGAVRHFSPGFIPYNLRMYFWSPATWTAAFPFIDPGELPPRPAGFGEHAYDRVFGLLTNLPLVWFALAAPLALRGRMAGERRRLRDWLLCTAVLFATMALFLASFFGHLARYMLDFTPALMLLACVGVLAAERTVRSSAHPERRLLVRAVGFAALLFSSIFAVLFSLQVNGLFREQNPAGYAAVARALNRGPAWVQRVVGVRSGSWELLVELPRGRTGTTETLLSVGDPPAVERVFVRYLEPTQVQLGFVRAAMPEVLSPPLLVAPGQQHRISVTLGAMLPPVGHPWYDGMSGDAARRASRLIWLQMDGQTVVQAFRRFDRTSPPRVRAGERSLGDAAYPRFTGRVQSARRRTVDANAVKARVGAGPARTDTFELMLTFPAARAGAREPLVTTGATGQGDIVGVEYADGGRIRFFVDHWGSPLVWSGPITLDRAAPHAVRIRLPWLSAEAGQGAEKSGELRVELDGAVVWKLAARGYPADPEEVTLGENWIGGSECGPRFTGTLLRVR